jgi:hypothetical protein
MQNSKQSVVSKIPEFLVKTLKLPYWLFIPICYFLSKVIFWFPESVRQYAFYLRVPILAAILIFVLLPAILQVLLRNVFIMCKWYQVSLGIVATLLASRSIIVVANSIAENAPARFGIAVAPTFVFPWDCVASIVLGMPLIIGIITNTHREERLQEWPVATNKSNLKNERKFDTTEFKTKYKEQLVKKSDLLLGCLVGFLAAFGLFAIDKLFLSLLEILKKPISDIFLFVSNGFSNTFSFLLKWLDQGISDPNQGGYFHPQENDLILNSGHLAGLSFFIIALIIFAGVGYKFRPNDNGKVSKTQGEAPVIIYMMAFLAIVVPILATMTFALDLPKFPVILTAVIFIALSYFLWDIDYYFEWQPSNEDRTDRSNFETAIENRLKFQGSKEEGRTLVVVTASGGGIQAAGWTAQVLVGLQAWLGKEFSKSIGLISSVSGGSVGSLFFVDYCEDDGAIADNKLSAVVQDAVQDGLDTVGWGLVYRDLGNIVGLPWFSRWFKKVKDRGQALEYSWQNTRAGKKDSDFATLNNWGKKALAGKIPIPVFNTTLVEDGRRMLFSPMTFSKGIEDLTIDSNTLYENYDLKAVTAARLSATFPYVSPTSRNPKPKPGSPTVSGNYHIVDGGYFDNSGIVTAVDWLGNNMDMLLKEVSVKRLVLLEIEAFETPSFGQKVEGRGGFLMAFLAPFTTLLSVKTASLIDRNQQETDLLINKYRSALDGIGTSDANSNVQFIKIEFPTCKYRQPLSWKLSPSEQYALEDAWKCITRNPTQVGLHNLKRLWHDKWGFPEPSANLENS